MTKQTYYVQSTPSRTAALIVLLPPWVMIMAALIEAVKL